MEVISHSSLTLAHTVMDDYVHTFMTYLSILTAPTLASSSLLSATHLTLSALACPATETILVSLDTLAMLAQRHSHNQFQPLISSVFAQLGHHLTIILLAGITQHFPEDGLDQVQQVLTAITRCTTSENMQAWVVEALEKIPGNVVPPNQKAQFVKDLQDSGGVHEGDRIRNALNSLVRAARKARDRGRQSRKSLGAV